jgi:hypothetical protein
MQRSAIREAASACDAAPDFAEPVIGRAFRATRWLHPGYDQPLPFAITPRASVSPINTNADVTSGPPTRIRVGVFILFHS